MFKVKPVSNDHFNMAYDVFEDTGLIYMEDTTNKTLQERLKDNRTKDILALDDRQIMKNLDVHVDGLLQYIHKNVDLDRDFLSQEISKLATVIKILRKSKQY